MSGKKTATADREKTRPTIGLLINHLRYTAQQLQGAGVAEAARERDANLICFVGGTLRSPYHFGAQANVLYDLVNVEQLDGLVIWSGVLDWYITPEEMADFCRRYHPLPVISVEAAFEGVPGVLLDNYGGMREIVAHLIEGHGYRRIAFLRGPEGSLWAEERYRAYVETLADYGLPLDPSLVPPPEVSWGVRERAEGAAQLLSLLLDEREPQPQVDFEAVVAATDAQALALLGALQARGINVPGDVAVTGFDNLRETGAVTPPLTTVYQPFPEAGRQAVEMVLAQLRGEPVPQQAIVPTKLIVRQSCGCTSPAVVHAAVGPVTGGGETFEAAIATRRKEILSDVTQAAAAPIEGLELWAEQLLDSFVAELEGEAPGAFLAALDEILHQVMAADGNAIAWQEVVSTLRRHALPHLGDNMALSRAEDLWQQARVAIGEAAQRAQAYQGLQEEQQAQALREIGETLSTTFDVVGLTDVLAQALPQLGIERCYLSLYEDPKAPAEWSRLMMAYDEKGRVALEPDGRRFPTHQLVPEGMLPQERQYSMVVEPLYFREDQIGFVLLEEGPRKGEIEMLRGQLSSALKGALLVEKREQRLTDALEEERSLLRTLIDNLPEYVFAKDAEGRFVVGNIALARHMGATTPDDLIGKTDFDFYPQELAAQFYADEQALLQSGQSMLDHEEATQDPDGNPRWTLTTKALLRDSQGKVTGLVGVSRDITERKQVEEALARERNLLRTLIDNLPEYYVFAKDAEGRFVVGNIALARHMGAATPDDLIGKTDFDFYPQELAAQFYADEQALLQSDQSMLDHEEATRDPDGNPRWTLTTKVLLHDSRGKVTGLAGVSRDITERKRVELALERRAVQLQTAAEVSRAASSILDPDELTQQAVSLIRERFDLYYVGLFLVDQTGEWTGEPGRWAVLRAGTGEAGQRMLERGHRLEVGGESMIGWCIANKQARIALDVGEEAVRFENPFLPETRSELALPLVSRGKAIGALTIQSSQEAAFSDEDIAVLQTMASQVANAIENTRLFVQAQLRAEEMVVLNELGQALSTHLSVRDVLNEVHQGASRLLDATNFYVALYDPDAHQVTFPYETTEEEEDLIPVMSADQGLTGYVIRHHTSLLVKEDVPERMAEMGIEVVGKPALSWLGAPMMAGGQVLGMLGVQSFTVPRAYDEHDQDLLVALANQTANAIANARLFEQVQAALREMGAVHQRYLQQAWSEYLRSAEVTSYETEHPDVSPLGDALLPEVRQVMERRNALIVDGDGSGRSALAVPIVLRGAVIGVLGIHDDEEGRRWTEDEISLVEEVVARMAQAAESIRLLDDTQHRVAREQMIGGVTARLRETLDMDTILQTAAREIREALGLRDVTIQLEMDVDRTTQ
jgi:PAS domain S-box-containing protein